MIRHCGCRTVRKKVAAGPIKRCHPSCNQARQAGCQPFMRPAGDRFPTPSHVQQAALVVAPGLGLHRVSGIKPCGLT